MALSPRFQIIPACWDSLELEELLTWLRLLLDEELRLELLESELLLVLDDELEELLELLEVDELEELELDDELLDELTPRLDELLSELSLLRELLLDSEVDELLDSDELELSELEELELLELNPTDDKPSLQNSARSEQKSLHSKGWTDCWNWK